MAESGRENWAVDELLKAEEEANQIIKNAQKEREKKIKEARVAADQEIAIFRREEEDRYKAEIVKVKNKIYLAFWFFKRRGGAREED